MCPWAITSPSTLWKAGITSDEASTIGTPLAEPVQRQRLLHRLGHHAEPVLCAASALASSPLRSALPNSSGYLRSSSHAAAVQYWLRASAAERIVVSSVRLNALSSFFSPSLNARCSLFLGSPIQR